MPLQWTFSQNNEIAKLRVPLNPPVMILAKLSSSCDTRNFRYSAVTLQSQLLNTYTIGKDWHIILMGSTSLPTRRILAKYVNVASKVR